MLEHSSYLTTSHYYYRPPISSFSSSGVRYFSACTYCACEFRLPLTRRQMAPLERQRNVYWNSRDVSFKTNVRFLIIDQSLQAVPMKQIMATTAGQNVIRCNNFRTFLRIRHKSYKHNLQFITLKKISFLAEHLCLDECILLLIYLFKEHGLIRWQGYNVVVRRDNTES